MCWRRREVSIIAAEDYLFVDEVACINCMICTEAAPNTFKIIDYPGGPDNCGNGWAARVHTQWGDGEELLWEATEYCPRGCIYWVPRAAVRTLEYVAQADDSWPSIRPGFCVSLNAFHLYVFILLCLLWVLCFFLGLEYLKWIASLRSSSQRWEGNARTEGADLGKQTTIQCRAIKFGDLFAAAVADQ